MYNLFLLFMGYYGLWPDIISCYFH